MPARAAADEPDLERRFGGLRRLHGDAGYQRLRAAKVAVVGLGGVGSWAAEALARSGIASLWLIDLDHVAESNINRQVQAVGATLGMAKAEALRQRIADIHPGCIVHAVEAFVDADNWPGLLGEAVDVLIDACDQAHAKLTLATWSHTSGTPVVCVGAAGGKQAPQAVEVADLADVSHDPLLAGLRQRLRRSRRGNELDEARVHQAHRTARPAARPARLGLRCVFSREAVQRPPSTVCTVDGSLNCAGYGSSVMVTATFGLVAAHEALRTVLAAAAPSRPAEAVQEPADTPL